MLLAVLDSAHERINRGLLITARFVIDAEPEGRHPRFFQFTATVETGLPATCASDIAATVLAEPADTGAPRIPSDPA